MMCVNISKKAVKIDKVKYFFSKCDQIRVKLQIWYITEEIPNRKLHCCCIVLWTEPV